MHGQPSISSLAMARGRRHSWSVFKLSRFARTLSRSTPVHIAFPGRKVVVAGGSRGIGRSIALAFAEAGADVSICARNAATLEETRAEIARHGRRTHAASCDLGDGAAVTRYVGEAAAALGGIDVLVNNASGFGMADDEAGWKASIDIDLLALIRASHAAIPHLEKASGSAILNISSISGYGGSARSAPYAAIKAAVINYTMSQALLLAPKKIRVNAIAPGSIEFPGGVWDKRKTDNPKLYNATLGSIPWGRMGAPEEIATVALFLCSDQARWVTGQTVQVDGGQALA
jgi:3-oxoacyl-[acyl-carrier protein] reductase